MKLRFAAIAPVLLSLLFLSGCFFESAGRLIPDEDVSYPFPENAVITIWSKDTTDPSIWTQETRRDGSPETGTWSFDNGLYQIAENDGSREAFQLRFAPLYEGSRSFVVEVSNSANPASHLYALAMMGREGRLYVELPSPARLSEALAEELDCIRSETQSCYIESYDELLRVFQSLSEDVNYEGFMKLEPTTREAAPASEEN